MPTPPKESIGGFVQSMFEVERAQLDLNSTVIENLMSTTEFETYDQDFKNYVTERLHLIEVAKSNIDSLEFNQ